MYHLHKYTYFPGAKCALNVGGIHPWVRLKKLMISNLKISISAIIHNILILRNIISFRSKSLHSSEVLNVEMDEKNTNYQCYLFEISHFDIVKAKNIILA
jgi:hypothetical protein